MERLIEHYYSELRGFAFAMLERGRAQGERVSDLKIYWAEQAPHPARVYDLQASALVDGEYIQLVDEDEGGIPLDVDFPVSEIRRLHRKHPAMRGFFVNAHPDPAFDLPPARVKKAVTRLERWFASERQGLPTGHQDDTPPAYEFDWVIFLVMDACIDHLERDLRRDPRMKKAGVELTGDDGDRCGVSYDVDEIARYREANGYRPTRAFLTEYLSVLSSSAPFVGYWAEVLETLPRKDFGEETLHRRSPHPLAGLPDEKARRSSAEPRNGS